ncbi:unnamed protein product [Schistosoma margrebowiei]|uniref:Uncharacterized protein n=1 Tax=Schistosoma margrebowiei TaxID=48269 RepID=A0A183M9J7_9TREM|nr:unnamed protein product [Schistosoma margrebowiei]
MESPRPKEKRKTKEHITQRNGNRHEKDEQELDGIRKGGPGQINVNPTDIADGKPAIVLGLIWVIILYFQIEEQEELLLKILDLPPGSLKARGSAKRALQTWVQEIFAGFDAKR